MLQIEIPGGTLFDEKTNRFFEIKGQVLQLEHSLVSISKWESKWHKPFLGLQEKTWDEAVDYIRCMTCTQNVNPAIYMNVDQAIMKKVDTYINDPMTATWFNDKRNQRQSHQVVTAELVYYWMIALEIPFECQKWHFNKLMTLIRVCNEKNAPQKKMSANDVRARNRSLNQARRARHHSRG